MHREGTKKKKSNLSAKNSKSIMEVTRQNFTTLLPVIQELLRTCDFYAFDVEMTGIDIERLGRGVGAMAAQIDALPHNCRFYNTPKNLFGPKWETATTFSPMQFGLSIFHRKSSSSSPAQNGAPAQFEASTFSWHLFPSFHYGDTEIRMSSETIGSFLAAGGMDFNAWVRNSLLYAPRETVASVAVAQPVVSDGALVAQAPSNEVTKVKQAFALLQKFADTNRGNSAASTPNNTLPFLSKDAFPVVLTKAKSLGLKVYSGAISWVKASVGGDPSAKHQANVLFEAMINSKKPAVAHNSWSDLVFLYRAFHSTPLTSYGDFKEKLRALFPTLYDTRTLSCLDSSLKFGMVRGALDKTFLSFKNLHEGRTTIVSQNKSFSEGSGAAHNAGYDAFITGSLFLYVSAEMKKHEGLNVEQFNGVVPVYGSVFSISLHTEHDYLVQARNAPVFYCVPAPTVRGGGFVERVATVLENVGLPGIPMNCGDSALLYVVGSASSLTQLAGNVRNAQMALNDVTIIDMKVNEYIEGLNGSIQYFPLPPIRV
jgi:poly(A)-specific ribonuclease